ncbi:hypothetical protein TorRG33x02_138390 [Trema orientale]|uniref:Uncharacterized protein n=1 Tax=Trema orientale TaxID=63057 RepID=A0A2P5EXV9_TREOI|nr:hypothetical protein TorRG33x02_138390 [Trema orientale]
MVQKSIILCRFKLTTFVLYFIKENVVLQVVEKLGGQIVIDGAEIIPLLMYSSRSFADYTRPYEEDICKKIVCTLLVDTQHGLKEMDERKGWNVV